MVRVDGSMQKSMKNGRHIIYGNVSKNTANVSELYVLLRIGVEGKLLHGTDQRMQPYSHKLSQKN